MRLPAPHSDFIGFDDDTVHLASGGQPPLLKAHERAFAEFAADRDIRIRAASDGIHVWDGRGRVRASAHLFNSERDVDRYLAWFADNVAP